MNVNDVISIITNKGFRYAKGNIPKMYLFFKQTSNDEIDVCLLINHTEEIVFRLDSINTLKETIERKFLFNGFRKMNFFYIVLSDNIERDKIFLSQTSPFWIIDTLGKRIMVYENQPNDYYNMRKDVEYLFSSEYRNTHKQNIPFVTVGLIAINVIIFLIMSFFSGGSAFDTFLINGASYWKYVYENHEYYRLFTCMFLHFSAEHLMNNMITLAFLGAETEKALGHLRYLVIYILSGLGASILSSIYYMHNSGDTVVLSAGASGAIFGILGALIIITLLSKKQRRNLNPANLVIIAVLSICNGYTSASIDNFAHIGGFLFGIIITFISCLYRKNILK